MCGIFGFILKNSLSMTKVFDVLKDLEVNQYPSEEQPLGGYGAGIAVMLPDGNVISEKVGKNSDSPANALERIKNKKYMNAKLTKANVLGHV